MANKIEMSRIVEKHNLKNLTPDVDLSDKYATTSDINRPALQLTGFFEHFASERVQIIGYVEYTFLEKMDPAEKEQIYEAFLSYKVPCIIFCRNLQPDEAFLKI
ncbi:MAG: HPr(Ser) kinase/phosphatase, partial [Dorea sp.]